MSENTEETGAEAPQQEQSEAQDQEQQNKSAIDESMFEVKWRKKERPQAQTQAAPVEDVATLKAELEKERERVKELQDRVQRSAADLSNLRKRTESERGDMERFASMRLVQELLPVLDNFERAITTIPGDLARLTWIHGVILIERYVQSILERQGLAPIEAIGKPFNPYEHEAVAEVETDEAAPGTVVSEYQKGYTMHGRVIRPALVEIAAAPAQTDATAESEPAAVEPEATEPEEAEAIANNAETQNVGP